MLTIGDNPCLPEIIGNYYKYRYDNYGVWIGNKYVALPYFSYANAELKNSIKNYTKWEYRGFEPISDFYTSEKVSSILSLKNNTEIQYNSFKSNLKRKINKARKNGIFLKKGSIDLLSDFYSVYFINMKHLGSPALPLTFFNEILLKYQNGNAKIFVAYFNNKPIGSAFLLSFNDFYENTWFATLRKFNHLYPSYLMHWEMIKFSIQQNAKIYSFGRSNKNSSVYYYKKQWNAVDLQLYWSYSEPKKLQIRNIKILSKFWKLIPDFIVKFIGPILAKEIY